MSYLTIDFVEQAIRRARNHDSCLDRSVLDIHGFSTGVMRRIFSNICEGPGERCYVEVGAYCGGTACAAINNKEKLTAFIFEDFSQSFGAISVREQLERNLLATVKGAGAYTELIERNYLVALDQITRPVGIYFYDGRHDREDQAEALPAMFPLLAERFLFIVDDANWETVIEGTKDGFNRLIGKLEIIRSWLLQGQRPQDDPVFHNGLALYLCQKTTA